MNNVDLQVFVRGWIQRWWALRNRRARAALPVHLVMIGNAPISRTIRGIVSVNVLFHGWISVSTMMYTVDSASTCVRDSFFFQITPCRGISRIGWNFPRFYKDWEAKNLILRCKPFEPSYFIYRNKFEKWNNFKRFFLYYIMSGRYRNFPSRFYSSSKLIFSGNSRTKETFLQTEEKEKIIFPIPNFLDIKWHSYCIHVT